MGKGLPLLLCLAASAGAQDSGWIRLKSSHFEVLTDAGANRGRDVLRRFEQIRHVFELRTGRGSLTPLPVQVFVFRSASGFTPYQVGDNTAGYYQSGYDRDYIAMQAAGDDTYRIVYHEYTHLLLRHAGYRVPVWFNEGTAELFSTADVGKKEVRIGDLIPSHVLTLREDRMLDLAELTSVDHDSPHYNERGKKGIFYAQSWALVHMLNFAPDYRPGLANFIEMILSGEDALSAFRQAFGKTPSVVLQDLSSYLSRARFEGIRFRAAKFDVGKIPSEPLSEVQSDLSLAGLMLAIGRLPDARKMYERLEAGHSENNTVRIALGRFAFRTGNFPAARQYFESAIAAGAADAEALYDHAMVLRETNQPDSLVMESLLRAVALDEAFFDARQFLGYLYLRGESYAQAIPHLKRATELQPSHAPVWENLAIAYQKTGAKDLALNAARAGRKAARNPEEAVRLDALIHMIETDADKIV